MMQGSAATGTNLKGEPFDQGRVSDFDVAVVSPKLLEKAEAIAVQVRGNGNRTAPLTGNDLRYLGLLRLARELRAKYGRPVNIMVFRTVDEALKHEPKSIPLP